MVTKKNGTTHSAQRAFAKKLYKLAAIKEAMAAFTDFATLELQPTTDGWTVLLADVDSDFEAEVVASEFANFVLAKTIARAR